MNEKNILHEKLEVMKFCFACTSLCKMAGDQLPFRVIGIARQTEAGPDVLDYELSLPFFCELG